MCSGCVRSRESPAFQTGAAERLALVSPDNSRGATRQSADKTARVAGSRFSGGRWGLRGTARRGFVDHVSHLGLSFRHALRACEHNAIVDMPCTCHSRVDEEDAFQRARLINAAIIARIHAAGWARAVLPDEMFCDAMNGNWSGLVADLLSKGGRSKAPHNLGGTQIHDREFGGTIGNDCRDHGVAYSTIQAFMRVRRLHSSFLDDLVLHAFRASNGQRVTLAETRSCSVARLRRDFGRESTAFSACRAHASHLALNTCAPTLMRPSVPECPVTALARTDVPRDCKDVVPHSNKLRRGWGCGSPRPGPISPTIPTKSPACSTSTKGRVRVERRRSTAPVCLWRCWVRPGVPLTTNFSRSPSPTTPRDGLRAARSTRFTMTRGTTRWRDSTGWIAQTPRGFCCGTSPALRGRASAMPRKHSSPRTSIPRS